MSDLLKQYRDKIDSIDNQLLDLVNQRASFARQIGSLKDDGVIYRPEREAQILRRLVEMNQGPLSSDSVTAIFRSVMSNCRALEKELSVAFLGPKGTYSEEASIKQFGEAAKMVDCFSIDEVFRSVEVGNSDYGIVPVENSTEGAVGRTLDLLMQTKLRVCGEVNIPVHHFLLSKHDKLDDVKTVIAHTQSLAQCHEWLNKNLPQASRESSISNAEAASIVNQGNNHMAAIASNRAAELFGLKVLAENIEDDPRNTTRFLVLSKHDVAPSGHDKTSLMVATKNVPGAVVSLLEPFAEYGVSMTKFESRPSKLGLWEYVFFIDVEGHLKDNKLSNALAVLENRASILKVFGSYPTAVN